MTATIDVMKDIDVRQKGTAALLQALGPLGMAKYLEQYDNGGQGNYTEEKYQQPDYSIEDILNM